MLNKLNKYLDLKTITSSIVIFILLAIASFGALKLPSFFPVNSPTSQQPIPRINVSAITKESIEQSKKTPNKLDFDRTLPILDSPIQTPPFVTEPDRLRDYLGKVSKSILISGLFENAYLYIKTGDINIQNESIYVYLVDGRIADGHLYPPEAMQPITDNVFIYDLRNLPLEQFPYSLSDTSRLKYKNVVEDLFNYQPETNKSYYIGAFVSTTKLPNQITTLEIRYKCQTNSNCSIALQ